MIKYLYILLILIIGVSAYFLFAGATASQISFNEDIRPILNAKCMNCHGGVRQQGGLSFLFKEDAYKLLESGHTAIVPGKPSQSELIHRITTEDPEMKMPPEGISLSDKEVQLINKWIKQGAKWETHWAYEPPDRNKKIPTVGESWAANPIDRFVYKKLQENNLSPTTEASKRTLLRRTYLDVIGLPPTLEEMNSFLENNVDDAFDQLVDQLLNSVHFGEKWASMWLDLARYADSQGFQKDLLRKTMWMYRDWVIHALNQDMPFNQFTIEQLAGDLLDEPSDQQILATAFHRNTMTNDEGGTDDEEYRVRAVLDRVNTTMEVWQGTTISCVQCHSHPYDPIRHEEYYALKGFFNNTLDHDHSSEYPTRELLSTAQKEYKKSLLVQLDHHQTSVKDKKTIERLTTRLASINTEKVPVMGEMPKDSSRKNNLFIRGNWLMTGPEIPPGVPESLNQTNNLDGYNRLSLAKWLVDPQNPLTARVIVNRIWEQIFGRGIVETLEDFGTQGIPPSHPDLLDWLAGEFMYTHNWSIKSLIKQIVQSSTYQQDSKISPHKLEVDPYNILLSRGSRQRLSAEQIRDQVLTISGLLNRKAYGPSVMPYQPEGVWNVIRHVARWETSEEGDAYRRAIYTFWRRVSPYPSMLLFDTPSREMCVSRRVKTNTPLQALALLNDPVFTEAAMALTDKTMVSLPNDTDAQLEHVYVSATIQNPVKSKLAVLKKQYELSLASYMSNDSLLASFEEAFGKSTPNRAALYNVCSTILNLDEVIMKK